jgi:mannose-6-phosphate isomerase-like protein (cupin superfamily)
MERRSILQSVLAAIILKNRTQTAMAQSGNEPVFVAAGEDRFHDPAMLPQCKLSGKDTNGAMCVFGSPRNNPGYSGGVPLHVHHHQDEFWYVADGEILFQVGDRKIRAKTGDSLFGPRGIPHSLRQMSEHGSLVSILQPAGTIEEFFRDLAQLRQKEKRMPSGERMAELFRAHGMEIVGPAVEP